MTKEKLWDIIIKRNPSFRAGPVKMSATSFRKLFDLVWDISADAERDVWAETDSIKHADLPPGFAKILEG